MNVWAADYAAFFLAEVSVRTPMMSFSEFSGDEFAKVISSSGTAVWVVVSSIVAEYGLVNRRSEADIPGMATIVQCNCDAE